MPRARAILLCSLILACVISHSQDLIAAEAKKVEVVNCSAPPHDGYVYIDLEENITRLTEGDVGLVYEFKVPLQAQDVTIDEEKRQSRLGQDLTTIFKAITKRAPDNCVRWTRLHKRSMMTIEGKDKNGEVILQTEIAVGPPEHLYLSADMPVTKIKQIVYDSDSKTFQEKEKPSSFYLGLNWRWGDLYTHHSVNEFYKDLSLKALFKASSHPSDSMGLGIGYSLPYCEIFVASVWTQNDDSVPGTSKGTTQSYIVGLSFNISKGMEWLKDAK